MSIRKILGLTAALVLTLSAAKADHSVAHAGNPLVARFKSLYPARVLIDLVDTGEVFTVENTGRTFDVSPGENGDAYLIVELDQAGEARLGELLGDGWPADPLARLEVAGELYCRTMVNFGNPNLNDPEESGSGPRLDRPTRRFVNLRHSLLTAMDFLDRASNASSKAKKIYYGLRAKMEFKALEDWKRTFVGRLRDELRKDMREGNTALREGGHWSAWVDAYGFIWSIQAARGASASMLKDLKDHIQGSLQDLRREGDTAGAAVLQARLALVEAMQDLPDYECDF